MSLQKSLACLRTGLEMLALAAAADAMVQRMVGRLLELVDDASGQEVAPAPSPKPAAEVARPRGHAPSPAPAPTASLSLFSDLKIPEREERERVLPPPRPAPPTAEVLAPAAALSPELAQLAQLAECAVSDVAGAWRKFTAMKAGLPLGKVPGAWQKWLVDELRHELRHQRAPAAPKPAPRPVLARPRLAPRDTEPAIPPPAAFLSVLAGLAKGRPAQGHVQAQGA